MIDILKSRHSIRKYEKKPVDTKAVDTLKEALLLCPSSRDLKPGVFVFVDDGVALEKLSRCKPLGSAFLKGAPLAIVVCGDETKSDVWVEDCSIASFVTHLTAHSLGLGSCWIQVRNRESPDKRMAEDVVQEVLGLPKNLKVEAIVAVGYPAESRKPAGDPEDNPERIRRNHY
jgi:nitroreductase